MVTKKTFGLGTFSGLGTFGPGTLAGDTPAPRWMVPGWCGCCTCTYFFDQFTRVDNASLGGNWTESAGVWDIENYDLKTASSNAFAQCSVEGDDDEHVVSVASRGMAEGDQARLISSKILTEDSYWFFEVTWNATTVTMELYQRTLGVDTQRGSTTTIYNIEPGISLALRICFNDSTIAAQYRRDTSDPTSVWITATSYAASVTDSTCGVGSGTVSGEIRFDDFRLEKHGSLYPHCPLCVSTAPCSACTDELPNEILAVPNGSILNLPDSGCTDCARVMGDGFVLKRILTPGQAPIHACMYRYEFEPPICLPVFNWAASIHYLYLFIGIFSWPFRPWWPGDVPQVYAGIHAGGITVSGNNGMWYEFLGTEVVECSAFDGLELLLIEDQIGLGCDMTNVTWTLNFP